MAGSNAVEILLGMATSFRMFTRAVSPGGDGLMKRNGRENGDTK